MSRPTPLTSAEQGRLRQTARRLGLQTAALVLVCLTLVGAVVVGVVKRGQTEDGERRIEAAARSIDDVHDAPTGMWVAIKGPRGLEVSDTMPIGLPDLAIMDEVARSGQDRRTRIEVSAGTLTAFTAQSRGRTVQVVLDPQEAREEMERLVTALVVAGGVGVILAGLGGTWLGRRAVRPTVEALALQRRFVADASHELRTPLTLLSTRAQLLKRHVRAEHGLSSGSRLPEDVDGLLEDTRALTSILEDMLLAADARSVDLTEVDIAVIADATVDAARATAQGRHVELARSGPSSVVATVSAVSVRRAVTALVDNALDHATGHVGVVVARDGDAVVVRVEDDGPGIAGEAADLFERFASRRTGAPPEGDRRHYGLGLALVAEVAAQHGGSVVAGPRPDGREGAALTLRLRAAGPAPRR
ncbi:His Kinase A (phospho-acceptor) domain-containing protein [Sanguibacter gelidistatuariae]|uniref:histidine kinase n=1 Tax=Sanguibacter gelidistatuariae TaxID=1814289 RepID=A0A1G6XJV4_9MICO|nr:HAMP domain-containing sensor histidine kinase [Sanguibacter gelidistatuariae]SDD78372.1 His Kinase A (phospho-acceptor) domain-containing protein [Sanguibacter gelidistatuariae]